MPKVLPFPFSNSLIHQSYSYLVAIVSLAVRLNLGFGYTETADPMNSWEGDWIILAENCPPSLRKITWSAFVRDSEAYVEETHTLVAAMYKGT